jgi:hypothetical protein
MQTNEDDLTVYDIYLTRDTRNADVTVEDFRALLADEMTPQDIYDRRNEKQRKREHRRRVGHYLTLYGDYGTRRLLAMYRAEEPWKGHPSCHDWSCDYCLSWFARVEAMKAILDTRENIPTGREAKVARREAALRNRGQRKAGRRNGRNRH